MSGVNPTLAGLAKSVKGLIMNFEAEKSVSNPTLKFSIAMNLAEIRFLAQVLEYDRGIDHTENLQAFIERMKDVQNN